MVVVNVTCSPPQSTQSPTPHSQSTAHSTMSGRYSPPPHPHPERTTSFNPLAHLLKHLADSPPTSPVVFTKVDLGHPDTHDPEDILRELRSDGDHPFTVDRNILKKIVQKKMGRQVEAISFISSGQSH